MNTALSKLKADVEKLFTDLIQIQADLEEKKSLHIAEVERFYEEIIENAIGWRRDCLNTVDEGDVEWRLACLRTTIDVELKIEELTNRLRFSNEQLYESKRRAKKGHEELIARLVEKYPSATNELQRHRDVSSECHDHRDCDVVISSIVYLQEERISTPRLKFTERLSDCVLIQDNDTVLVNVEQGTNVFHGALTDGRLLRGSHYWELDLSFNVKKAQGNADLVYSAGLVRIGSDFGHYVGYGNLSWCVEVSYRNDQYIFGCGHNGQMISTQVPLYPENVSGKRTVRQGFYLNCNNRTLTIIDVTNSRELFTHRDVDLSEPLTPAVSVHNFDWVDVCVRIVPCNLSNLVKVLHNSLK